MAVSSIVTSIEYAGNVSTETPYTIPFRFIAASDVHVSVTSPTTLGVIESVDATGGAGFRDYTLTMNEGTDPVDDVPAIGDVLLDAASNEGTIVGLTDNGNGTLQIRVLSSSPFDPADEESISHAVVETLDAADFTVTQLVDGTGSLVTGAAYLATQTVRVFRQTPLLQPAEFPAAGPFPSTAAEQALDRATLIIQELAARIETLEGGGSQVVVVPAGDGSTFNGIRVFADAAARAAAVPDYVSQIGVQTDTAVLYRASSVTAGAWAEVKHRAWDRYAPIAYNAAVGDLTERFIGTVPENGTLREVVFAVATAGTNDIDFELLTTNGAIQVNLPAEATSVSVASTLAMVAGDQMTLTTSSSYGSPDALGLEIFFAADRV